MSKRRFLQWSPHSDRQFLAASQNVVRVYELSKSTSRQHGLQFSFSVEAGPAAERDDALRDSKEPITLVSANTEVQHIRALAWSPDPAEPNLIAAADKNGRITIASFSLAGRLFNFDRVFSPSSSRAANALAWPGQRPTMLAEGLEKGRGGGSLLIWDINAGAPTGHTSLRLKTRDVTKPVHELIPAESVVALGWFPGSPDLLAAGTGSKFVRVVDLRDPANPLSITAHSKSVFGCHFNPSAAQQMATYSEDGVIKIWDTRRLEQPTHTVSTNAKGRAQILQVAWSPTRPNILASLAKDEKRIRFWDLTMAEEAGADASVHISKAYKSHSAPDVLGAIAWHPSLEFRLLTLSQAGQADLLSLNQSIPVCLAPAHSTLAFGSGRGVVEAALDSPDSEGALDIAERMRRLAERGYNVDVRSNLALLEPGRYPQLHQLWAWMAGRLAAARDGRNPFEGVYDILFGAAPGQAPGVGQAPAEPFDLQLGLKVFNSQARQAALRACGWPAAAEELEPAVAALERDGQYETAAALAVFSLSIKRALTALSRGQAAAQGDERERAMLMRLTAMALAGWSDGKIDDLWRETTAALAGDITHPHLRAMLQFLASGQTLKVLESAAIPLRDKLGIACRFVALASLHDYLNQLKHTCIQEGQLDGLLITGLSREAVELFDSYLTLTGDVQTAALCLVHAIPRHFQEPRYTVWLDAYSGLLDRWRLWHCRAHFDSQRIAVSESKPAKQIFARCNFCNSPLALQSIQPTKLFRGRRGKTDFRKTQVSSCPSCNKSLPRCALCLLPLDAGIPAAAGAKVIETADGVFYPGTLPLDAWYSWCQTCRHGGHSQHMQAWFAEHPECPVTDCPCRCAQL